MARNKNAFDYANEWIKSSEYSVVNLASTIAPWLTPLVPAYLSYTHLVGFLQFPEWAAIGTAVAVEILGFATISTSIDFWKHNCSPDGRAKYKKMPIFVPLIAFMLYFMTILSLNVLLELPIPIDYAPWVRVLSIFFLITLTIPAGALVAVRALHTDVLYMSDKKPTNVRQMTDKPAKKKTFDRGFDGFLQYVEWKGEIPSDKVMIASEMNRSPRQIDRYLSRYADEAFGGNGR